MAIPCVPAMSVLLVAQRQQKMRSLLESTGLPITIDAIAPSDIADPAAASALSGQHEIAFLDLGAAEWQDALLNLRMLMPVVVYDAPSCRAAVDAMKLGATDCVDSPATTEAMHACLCRYGKQALEHRAGFDEILGSSAAIQEVFHLLKRAAAGESNVLISGESGTGKELAARAIHRWSLRRERSFLTINCSAIPDSLFESELFGFEKGAFTGAAQFKRGILELADGGTVFFDEIGEVSPHSQTKLLRAIQEGEIMHIGGQGQIKVNVRVIAATNRDLVEEIRRGTFREDLYYRLNVINIHLPPLRDRMEDIPLLVRHFLRKHSPKRRDMLVRGVSGETMSVLMGYSWPGNIRELENIIERAVSLTNSAEILPGDLPPFLQQLAPQRRKRIPRLREVLDAAERDTILAALQDTEWNISRAASLLGIYRQQLQKKIRLLHLAAGSNEDR